MRLKILQAGEAVLRDPARPLTREEIVSDEIRRLIAEWFVPPEQESSEPRQRAVARALH